MHSIRRALRITFGCQYRIVKMLECFLVFLGIAVIILTLINAVYVHVTFAALSVVIIGIYATLRYKSPGYNFTKNKIENRPLLILHYTVPVFGWVYCGLSLFCQIGPTPSHYDSGDPSFYAFYVSNIIFIPFGTWFITSAVKAKPIPDARLLHCTYFMAAFFMFYVILSMILNVIAYRFNFHTLHIGNIIVIYKVIIVVYISLVVLMLAELVSIFLTLSKDLHERLVYLRAYDNINNQENEIDAENANQLTEEDPLVGFPTIRQKMRLLLRNNRVAFGVALLMLLMTPLVIVSHLNVVFQRRDSTFNWNITHRWYPKLTDAYFIVIYLTYSIGVLMSALYFMRMKTWVPSKITKYLTDVIVVFVGTVVKLIISSVMIYFTIPWTTMDVTNIKFFYFLFAKFIVDILQVTSQFMTSREMLCKKVDMKGHHGYGNVERINAEERNRLDEMVAPSLILCLTNFILFIDNIMDCIVYDYGFLQQAVLLLRPVSFYRLHAFLFFLNVVCIKLEFYSND